VEPGGRPEPEPRRGARAKRRRILVTAGPTREHVDPVRYLSNESSGRMGFEIARMAVEMGHEAVLIAGPVHLETPAGVRRIDVVSARDMLAALEQEFPRCDALYMAAAVADWRPKRRLAGKWRAKDGGATQASIELVRNPDLLATVTGAAVSEARLAARKGARLVVAFALETSQGRRRALAKLKAKGADYVALNSPAALGASRADVTVLAADGSERPLVGKSKAAIARALLGLAPRG
jgi:phosphopantothenoylcysteine decarboxylase / phosphopantothenate---cysteine ligase